MIDRILTMVKPQIDYCETMDRLCIDYDKTKDRSQIMGTLRID